MEYNRTEAESRTLALLGEAALETLSQKHIIIFGLGGVGGHAFDALLRAGIGRIDVVDGDSFSMSNLNRQLLAKLDCIGKNKAECAVGYAKSIAPECVVTAFPIFYTEDTATQIQLSDYDYILDCVDMVSAKVDLALNAQKLNIPIISSMGAGNKLDPTRFRISDIYKTSVCPLAKVMRARLKDAGVKKLKCVWSDEEPAVRGLKTPSSVSFVPSVAGLIMAAEALKDMIR